MRADGRRDPLPASANRIVHVALVAAVVVVAIAMVQVARIRKAQRDEVRASLQEQLLGTARLIADMAEARDEATSFLLFAPVHGAATADREPLGLDEFRAFVRGRLTALGMEGDPRLAVFRVDTAGGVRIAEGDPAVLRPAASAAILARLAQPDAGWRRLRAGVFRADLVEGGVPVVVKLSPEVRRGGAARWFGIVHGRDHWAAAMVDGVVRERSVFPASFYGVDVARWTRSAAAGTRNLDAPLRAEARTAPPAGPGPFAVRLLGTDGRVVYASHPATAGVWRSPHAGELSQDDGGTLRVALAADLGDRIVDAAVPPDAMSWLLGVLAALGAIFLVAALLELRRRQELAEARRRLGAELSHEVRTPLAQIAALSETLLNGGGESVEQERRWLRTIGREARRLGHLANNVLLHETRDRDAVRVAPVPVDLHELVTDVAEATRTLGGARGVQVVVRVDDPLVVLADSAALRQILLNLLQNALEHGPDGQTITIAARRELDRVVVIVDDEGAGVAPADREAIWEPFRRSSGTEGPSEGSGLGLSIVRALTEAHGGRAGVQDAPGGGARFVVELPARPPVPRE